MARWPYRPIKGVAGARKIILHANKVEIFSADLVCRHGLPSEYCMQCLVSLIGSAYTLTGVV
jgi:hypothetical protein